MGPKNQPDSSQQIQQLVAQRFKKISVAVLGDLILDEYIYGRVSRLSPEAPVPVLEVQSRQQTLGGAGNVARNIASLGGRVRLFAAVGDDEAAKQVRHLAARDRIDVAELLVDDERPTTLKQRVAAQTQQIVRIDSETASPIPEQLARILGQRVALAARDCDVLIISDYDKGVITKSLLETAVTAFKRASKPVVVDPNVIHFFSYRDLTVITPNHLQLERVSGKRIRSEVELFEAGREIRARLGTSALLITRGEAGMALLSDAGITKIPTVAQEVYDVTGAGDTVVAVLALGLGAGLGLDPAARIANAAAGLVVGKRGTAVTTPDELVARLRELENHPEFRFHAR